LYFDISLNNAMMQAHAYSMNVPHDGGGFCDRGFPVRLPRDHKKTCLPATKFDFLYLTIDAPIACATYFFTVVTVAVAPSRATTPRTLRYGMPSHWCAPRPPMACLEVRIGYLFSCRSGRSAPSQFPKVSIYANLRAWHIPLNSFMPGCKPPSKLGL